MTIKKSYKGIRFLGLNDDECPKKGLYFKGKNLQEGIYINFQILQHKEF